MSVALLLDDLRQRSGQRVAAIWRQAESDAAALRTERERELGAARGLLEQQQGEAARAVTEPVIRAAEIEALRIQDNACRDLAGRLSALATEQLARIRQAEYPAIFAQLAAELPDAAWPGVRVNPQDLALARRHFPEADIKGDPAILGGFIAEGDGSRHRVVNTLEQRLVRAWPFALPILLRQIEEVLDAEPVD